MENKEIDRYVPVFQILFFLSLLTLYAIPCAGRFFYRDDFVGVFQARAASISQLWQGLFQVVPGNLFYRPIGNVSYSLDWLLWGPNSFMYFLHTIIWQLLSIYLIYKLVHLLTGNKHIAILSELLFLIYFPMNSGSVSLLSNRPAVMAVVFCLLSFYAFLKIRKEKKRKILFYTTSILSFTLAIFTKESAVLFVFVFMATDYLYFKGQKRLWGIYLFYFFILIARFLAGTMVKVASPFSGQIPDYAFVFGPNLVINLAYYTSWLLWPAAVLIISLWALSLKNHCKIELKKAFPFKISVFGLSFAFINLCIYLPFAEYRQLGWLHLSTIGMAIFLATPTYYFLNLILSRENARKNLIFITLTAIILFVSMGIIFLPSKLIERNLQAKYSKNFINDFSELHIGSNKKVYIVDIGSGHYRLSDTFISPMLNRDVLREALSLFLGDKTPKEIHLVEDLNDVKTNDTNTLIFYYKNGKILKEAP